MAGGVKSRGPPKVRGTTTISPRRAASAFDSPVIVLVLLAAHISAALARARSASREPMTIECPACAQRMARPAPSLPVPPRIAMFTDVGLLSEEIAGGIAQQGLGAFFARCQ